MKYLLIILTLPLLLGACTGKEEKKPNVVFILTDQWRSSALGYNGNDIVKTPRLDEFQKSAINFKNAVSVLPVCTPYRASLMTGRYPTTTGMFINDLYLPSEELCMAEIYNEAGYNTAYLGKWHIDGHGRMKNVQPERRQGWTYWKGAECDHNYTKEHYFAQEEQDMKFWPGYSTYSIAKEANTYIEEHANDENPFCIFVSLATPHFPHNTAPEDCKALYPREKLQLPPNVPESRIEAALKELQGYYGHCTATDKAIGTILDKLKEQGIYENSIIVFTSDHGEMMGSHDFRPYMKHQPYIESAGIPFLIAYPNMDNNAGYTVEAPLTTPDILPSLLGFCGIDIPKSIEGYDLSSMIKNAKKANDRAALYMNVAPFGIAFKTSEYRAIKTKQYTYVRYPDGPAMLFDDTKDVYQMNNLVDNPEFKDILATLNSQMDAELERIGDKDFKTRDYYLKKFGYYGSHHFRPDYHIDKTHAVDTVVSPYKMFANPDLAKQ